MVTSVLFDLLTPTVERSKVARDLAEEILSLGLAFVVDDSDPDWGSQTPRDWVIGRVRAVQLGKEPALQILEILEGHVYLNRHLVPDEISHVAGQTTGRKETFRDPEFAKKAAHYIVCPECCRTRPMAAYPPAPVQVVAKSVREAIPSARTLRPASPAPNRPYWDPDFRREEHGV